MQRRIALTLVWAYAGWTLGAFVAWVSGLPDLTGPAFALLGAFAFAMSPRPAGGSGRVAP